METRPTPMTLSGTRSQNIQEAAFDTSQEGHRHHSPSSYGAITVIGFTKELLGSIVGLAWKKNPEDVMFSDLNFTS